jgi:multidrug efflux pump subunit AcrA (membrane-fusion protein)
MGKFTAALSVLFRTILPTLLGLVLLIGVIAWLSGAFTDEIEPGRTESSPSTLGNEPTDVVREVTKDYLEEAVGTLKAASRTQVSAKVLATIEEITVSGGDLVSEGDVLIRLDHDEMQSRTDQAEQALLIDLRNQATRLAPGSRCW